MQSQINPHFLYNTLDTIQWKALEHNAYDVADMINSLSAFFRLSLSGGKEFITVADEIEHVKSYLCIQRIRYRDKVNYEIYVETAVSQYLVPKMIIQPLVENSIYHGLKQKKNSGIIIIKIFSEDNFIIIEVTDDGLSMSDENLKELMNSLSQSIETDHYGLYNINERLRLTFKDKYRIEITSNVNSGTTVTLKIPKITEGFQCLEQL